ncbi:MAG: outer membrane beta-barrel domain-containing protein [Gammaproteobacteria bacterium]
MKNLTTINTTIILLLLASSNTFAATTYQRAKSDEPQKTQSSDIITPDIERSETDVPRIEIEDYEIGAFTGIYSTEDFGADAVFGITGAYHFTEDIFFSATYASSTVSDSSNRTTVVSDKLSYFNLLFGYNILPGEVYSGAGKAWSSSTYFVAGLGATDINDSTNLTIILGGGLRLVPSKNLAIHVDFRDHILNSTLTGSNKSIQNIEITAGASWFF